MIYLERVNKLANFFFLLFAGFLLITVLMLFNYSLLEMLRYNYSNDLRGVFFTAIFLGLTLMSLIMGIILKILVKDSNDEIRLLEERIKQGLYEKEMS